MFKLQTYRFFFNFSIKKTKYLFGSIKKNINFAIQFGKREFSSVGLEHLPYKQGVTGSTPVIPTTKSRFKYESAFLFEFAWEFRPFRLKLGEV